MHLHTDLTQLFYYTQLGMVIPFTENADFSDMSVNKEPLQISKVIQKNFINVTEEGTEAASATAGKCCQILLPT